MHKIFDVIDIKNLEKPEYMNLLLNGRENLEDLFAGLEINGHKPISSTSHNDRVLPGFRKLIKMVNLPKKIIRFGEMFMIEQNPTEFCGHRKYCFDLSHTRRKLEKYCDEF